MFYEIKTFTANNNLVAKWLDIKPAHLISSYVSIDTIEVASRLNLKENRRISVNQPKLIEEYNEFMVEADLEDILLELYIINFKSRKEHFKIFFYFLDLSTTNA